MVAYLGLSEITSTDSGTELHLHQMVQSLSLLFFLARSTRAQIVVHRGPLVLSFEVGVVLRPHQMELSLQLTLAAFLIVMVRFIPQRTGAYNDLPLSPFLCKN